MGHWTLIFRNEPVLAPRRATPPLTPDSLQHEDELRGLPPKRRLVTAEQVKGAEAEAADPDEAMGQGLW